MKAIILAAGEGNRIKGITNKPKCLLEIAGLSLLENALSCLSREGFQEVILVVGYRAELIKEFGNNFEDMKLTYIETTLYRTTNNMFSLYLAREHLYDGAVILEGDVLFEPLILKRLLDSQQDCWAVDNFVNLDGAMLTTDQEGKITKIEIIREISTFPQGHKSVGIIRVSSDMGAKIASWLDEDVRRDDTRIYYDLVLAKRLDKHPIYICDIAGLKWAEIDNEEDYRKAQLLFG